MSKLVKYIIVLTLLPVCALAQLTDESNNIKQLKNYVDSLSHLGKKFINDPDDLERKNANYLFIKTLVSALKIPNSFNFPFDSVKSISVLNSPDKRFRIFSWHVMNQDGSYRYYGTIQMNSSGTLKMFPLEDYTPLLKNAEDTVADNRSWLGAQYYKIIAVPGSSPYYVLLGWKGNTVKSTKKVIEVLSFKNNTPVFGAPVFEDNGKTRMRVVFEYARQASMLLRHIPEQNLIVFDHLSAPDPRSVNKPETFGPDLSYDGYRLTNGKWKYVTDLDMRNIPSAEDQNEYIDPKQQAIKDRKQVRTRN